MNLQEGHQVAGLPSMDAGRARDARCVDARSIPRGGADRGGVRRARSRGVGEVGVELRIVRVGLAFETRTDSGSDGLVEVVAQPIRRYDKEHLEPLPVSLINSPIRWIHAS